MHHNFIKENKVMLITYQDFNPLKDKNLFFKAFFEGRKSL